MRTSTSISTKPLRWWAVRFGDYVEFRVGRTTPTAKRSTLVRFVEKERNAPVYDRYGDIAYKREKYKSRQTLKQTCWLGGKVLGVCKYSYLRAQGITVELGGMAEVTRAVKNLCLEKYGI